MAESKVDEKDCASKSVTRGFAWHCHEYSFWVRNLRDKELCTFLKEFETDCERMPTFWLFQMIFEKVQEDGKPRISFKLERTDGFFSFVHVEISFIVTLVHLPTIYREEIWSGDKIEEILTPNLVRPHYREPYDTKIGVNISIKILTCHDNL